MMKGFAILLATTASALAFSPQNPASWTQKSTVVQNVISSKITMMPDDPMPEVSSEHLPRGITNASKINFDGNGFDVAVATLRADYKRDERLCAVSFFSAL